MTTPEQTNAEDAAAELAAAAELVDRGDVGAAIRRLHGAADSVPLPELARVVGRAAAASGFDDLTAASSAVVTDSDDPSAFLRLRLRVHQAGAAIGAHDRLGRRGDCFAAARPGVPGVSGLLCQAIVPPWGEALRVQEDGSVGRSEPDDRPADALADEILQAELRPDGSDDADEDQLTTFVAAIRSGWPMNAPERDRMRSAGPVPSSRFF